MHVFCKALTCVALRFHLWKRILRAVPDESCVSGLRRRRVFSSSGDRFRSFQAKQQGPRSSVAKFFGAALGSLLAAGVPGDCRLCRAPLAGLSRLPVCDQCLERITPFDSPCCRVCGDPLPQQTKYGFPGSLAPNSEFLTVQLCAACSLERPLFKRAASFGAYAHELRELIHLLKYHRLRAASGMLGCMLAHAAEPLLADFESSVLVIPIPLHASKFRERGFNQSELIARSAIRELGRGAITSPADENGNRQPAPKLELLTTSLLRRRATPSQVGMSREQRRENIRGAFAVTGKEQIAGREVLLVDDVMTTGATVAECSRVLLGAGAKAVWAATVARALNESSWFVSHREEARELRE